MRKILYILLFAFILIGCANRGIGPQGGPKDSIPPVPRSSEPEMGALNFHGKKVEINFDEYIQLDDLVSNLLMSPPQKNAPEVKARGKKLIVQFQDTLRDSTTYTIDFGDAICDFREKVPLHGYSFYFSTGNEIDTLESVGYVYDATNLNPLKGIIVGIHANHEDSAFVSEPFLRIARTDSAGFFRIGNVHPGTYRLYAVDDISRDNRLTIGESLAFFDELVTPQLPIRPQLPDTTHTDSTAIDTTVIDSTAIDTTAVDTTALDTITNHQSPITNYQLSSLFLFKESQQKLYLQRTLREQQHCIRILFSSSPDSVPFLRPLTDSLNYHTQYSRNRDTITIWLADSLSIGQDSLFIEARYRRTDSLYHLEWYTDTLRAIWRAPRLTAKAKEAQERKNRNRRLELKSNARKSFELFDTLRLSCTTPLAAIERDSIHLIEKIDTVYKPVPFTLAPYDTLPMELVFLADLKAEGKYELRIDSGALHDMYGITHIAGTYPLQVKALADYSTLRVKLEPYEPQARIQVLNAKDQVLRELPASPEGALFEYLKPDTYYLRLYLDRNADGKWTTGSWTEKRQPEPIYYFPGKIQTKSNWDFEEVWDYNAVPQTEAKPKELIQAASQKKK